MKNKLLLLLIFTIFLYSCSNDDVSIEPIVNPTKQLLKKEKFLYENGSFNMKITTIYENNKPAIDSAYNSTNQLLYVSKNFFNTNNLVSSIKVYDSNGILSIENNITYDNLGRITQINNTQPSGSSVFNYTLNSNNTITSERISNGSVVATKTFFLNTNGIIYKEVNGNNNKENTFDLNNNLTQNTAFSVTNNYEYSEPHLKPLTLQFDNSTIVGSVKMNTALIGNTLDDQNNTFGDKLISKITSSNGIIFNYIYTYDSDNYPVNLKSYMNNVLVSEENFTYSN
jgi:hypothetical protein